MNPSENCQIHSTHSVEERERLTYCIRREWLKCWKWTGPMPGRHFEWFRKIYLSSCQFAAHFSFGRKLFGPFWIRQQNGSGNIFVYLLKKRIQFPTAQFVMGWNLWTDCMDINKKSNRQFCRFFHCYAFSSRSLIFGKSQFDPNHFISFRWFRYLNWISTIVQKPYAVKWQHSRTFYPI